jgi:hypothetical protein
MEVMFIGINLMNELACCQAILRDKYSGILMCIKLLEFPPRQQQEADVSNIIISEIQNFA